MTIVCFTYFYYYTFALLRICSFRIPIHFPLPKWWLNFNQYTTSYIEFLRIFLEPYEPCTTDQCWCYLRSDYCSTATIQQSLSLHLDIDFTNNFSKSPWMNVLLNVNEMILLIWNLKNRYETGKTPSTTWTELISFTANEHLIYNILNEKCANRKLGKNNFQLFISKMSFVRILRFCWDSVRWSRVFSLI